MNIPSWPSGPAPDAVLARSGGRPATPVWRNQIGGVTWTYDTADGREFLKIGPPHPEWDVVGEVERLRWVGRCLPAPEVLATHTDADVCWIATRALDGTNPVAAEDVARAEVVVPALGRGLRRFHDTLPVDKL